MFIIGRIIIKREETSMKKKRFLLLLLALAVAVFSAMAVSCKKKTPQESNSAATVDYFDYNNFFFDGANGEENTLVFSEGANFTLKLNGETYKGVYAYANGSVTLPVGNQTATLTYANEVITFVLDGNTYYFNKDINYSVSFNTNGGSSIASVTVKNGRTVAKPSDPTKDGFVFIGWYKSSDLTGGKFTFNGEKIKGDVPLYARWIEKIDPEYTVSFVLGYDAENPASMTTAGHKLFNVTAPSRSGYEFKGWWVSSSNNADKLSYKYNEETTVFDSDTTLFALWAKDEADAFLVNVGGSRIEWEGAKGSVMITVTSPSGDKLVDNEFQSTSANGGKNFAFSDKAAGEYVIEVTCSLGTVKRYYTNKALARACGFRVEDGTLVFADVKNAQKYYITVECGEPTHSHVNVETSTPSFDFSSCKMKVGGIKFTVRAVAENYAESVAHFTYDRTLASVSGLTYDENTASLKWNAVEGATNYCLTVNGTKYDTGNATTFDMRSFSGEISVSVVAEADRYNSSTAAAYSFTKATPATPQNLTLTGKTLTWNAVNGATYTLEVADQKGGKQSIPSNTTSIEKFDEQLTFALTAGSKFTVRIKATVNGVDSFWSDELTFNCLVMDNAPEYKNGTLYWNPVFGADGYEICVNGDENNLLKVGGSATSTKVTLAVKGKNAFKMRFTYGENKSEWTNETEVTAYAVEFESNGGTEVSEMLIAGDDNVTLPGSIRKGYDFVGWYDAKENGKKYDEKTFTDKKDLVLYAYWEARKYEVTFEYGEYGSGDESSLEVTYDSDFTLPVPEVDSKTAMAFIGWYDTPSEGGLQYAEGNGKGKFKWQYSNGVKLYARYAQAFEYVDDGSGSYMVKASSNFNSLITELYIPATYNGKPVREIAEYGFKDCRELKTVSIPDTIEIIASTAFINCSKISRYEIREATPGSPVSQPKFTVGSNGELLEHNYLTDDVELAFIPSTITQSEGDYTIPSVVTRMGEYLFKGAKFTRVIIPANVTEVSAYAFQSCLKLETIEFLATEKRQDDETKVEVKPLTISKDAIVGCSNLKELIFPERLQEMKDGDTPVDIPTVFSKFKKLESISVVGSCDGQVYSSIDGMLCKNSPTGPDTLVYCPRGKVFKDINKDIAGKDAYYVLEIPSQITKIGSNAFNSFNNLSNVSYEEGEYKLHKIVFPSLMVEIGDHAFYKMPLLEEVVFNGDGTGKHSGLTIDAYAFARCPKLKTLTFEEEGKMEVDGTTYTYAATSTCGVTEIGDYAFNSCAITDVLLPSTLDSIGKYAFGDNETLTGIDFSHSKTSLTYGDYSFSSCGLTELNLTDNVYIEGFNAIFRWCKNLAEVKVKDTNPFYTTVDGVLYNKDVSTVVFFPDGYTKDYELPSTVTKIAAAVFEEKDNLKRITIIKSVQLIDTLAFKGCNNLKELLFEEGGTEDLIIGDSAFQSCKAITNVVLPERTKRIGNNAFANDSALVSITLNNGLEIIGNSTFERSGLKFITIPYTVQKIGSAAFLGSLLEEVVFAETPVKDANGNAVTRVPLAFEMAKTYKNNEVFVPNGNGAFSACVELKRVVLPERLEYIPKSTFSTCKTLEYVFIPTTVQNSTVYNNTGSSKNTKVRAIGDSAFYGCYKLETIEFAKGGTGALSFGSQTFAGCESLTTLNLPNRIASVSTALLDVFQRKSSSSYEIVSFGRLQDANTKINYASGLKTINVEEDGEYASYDGVLYTKDLKSVVFCPYEREGAVHVSYKTQTFEKVAFGGCYKVSEIIFDETPDGETPVDFELQSVKDPSSSTYQEVFYGCISLKEINFPSRLTKIGDYALARYSDSTSSGIAKDNAIERITFAEGCKIQAIGKGAFKNSRISSITLPEIWTDGTKRGTIGKSIFQKCYNLVSVTLPKNITASEFVNISTDMPVLPELIIPAGSENFVKDPNGIVYGLENGVKTTIAYVPYILTMDTVVIPATVKTIADGAFSDRTGFKYLEFESGTEPLKIGANAFKNSSLESVTLPARLTEMGLNAFDGCSKLTTLEFAEGYQCASIPNYAFRNTAIEGVLEIPSKVSTIGQSAFEGTSITSVVFGRFSDGQNSVLTTMSQSVFKNCKLLVSVSTLDYDNSSKSENRYTSTSVPTTTAKGLGNNLFEGCVSLERFVLPEGMTRVPNNIFYGCASLESVNIPASVTAVGSNAFRECAALKSIDFSAITKTTFTINQNAFQESGVTEVIGFNKVTSLGKEAFADSALIGSLEINDVIVVKSATSAFKGTNITSLTINASSVPANMFQGCSKLKTVTLGTNVTTISSSAFNNCVELERVINKSTKLESIGANAFEGCKKFKIFADEAKTAEIDEGKAKPGFYVTGSEFESVGKLAFYGCSLLNVLDFSAALQKTEIKNKKEYFYGLSIGERAFADCSGVSEITFPDGFITTINKEAFRNCSGLTTIKIPEIKTYFFTYAFADCSGLETLIYEGKKGIPEGAFENCSKLKTVTIDDNVTTIAKNSFKDCVTLELIAFKGPSLPSFDRTSFENCVKLKTLSASGATFKDGAIYTTDADGNKTLAMYVGDSASLEVEDGTKAISANAFMGNTNLKSVNLKSVKTIGSGAFMNCYALESVVAPQMSFVDVDAFRNCERLNSIDLTKVRALKNGAFSGCKSLTSVQLVGIKEEDLGERVFDECSSLVNVQIDEMLYIGRYMFRNCTALKSFSFEGVTYIGGNAFFGCENLVTISNYGSVETFGTSAFEGCKNLILENADFSNAEFDGTAVFKNCINVKSLKLGGTVATKDSFLGCKNLQSVEFVNGLTQIWGNAFDGCENLDINNMDLSGITDIKAEAFKDCLQLTKIPLMPLMDKLPGNVFNGCVNITGHIDLRQYESWYANAFAGTGITEVTISAEQLKDNSLEGMALLTKANIIGDITELNNNAFAGCRSLSFDNIDFSKVVTVGGSAFKGCLGLTEVDMPSLLGIKSKDLFAGCENITKVSMPLHVIDTALGSTLSNYANMFKDMTKLTEVNIPNMRNIADGMFDGCVNLEKVNAPDVRSVGANAFRNCAKLTSLSTEKLDGKIGNNAFEGCTLLANINLSMATEIGAAAFKGCTSIAKIELNQFVTKIGANAFEGWTEGQTIDVSKVSESGKPSSWDDEMLTGCGAKVLWLGANA